MSSTAHRAIDPGLSRLWLQESNDLGRQYGRVSWVEVGGHTVPR